MTKHLRLHDKKGFPCPFCKFSALTLVRSASPVFRRCGHNSTFVTTTRMLFVRAVWLIGSCGAVHSCMFEVFPLPCGRLHDPTSLCVCMPFVQSKMLRHVRVHAGEEGPVIANPSGEAPEARNMCGACGTIASDQDALHAHVIAAHADLLSLQPTANTDANEQLFFDEVTPRA